MALFSGLPTDTFRVALGGMMKQSASTMKLQTRFPEYNHILGRMRLYKTVLLRLQLKLTLPTGESPAYIER